MKDMWKLYDVLTDEVDSDAYVTNVLCGRYWTLVKNSENGLGMALSPGDESRPALMKEYIGMPVRDAAACMRSWNMKEAGIGMAAANSYFNTVRRLEEENLEQPHDKWCTFGLDLTDKKIVLVGHLQHDESLFAEARQVDILEMAPQKGDFPASACEYLIPECDVLVITASSIVNKTLPRLLELGENAITVLTGPTAPMCRRFLEESDIQRITGFVPVDTGAVWNSTCLAEICSPYPFGRRFSMEKMAAGQVR